MTNSANTATKLIIMIRAVENIDSRTEISHIYIYILMNMI